MHTNLHTKFETDVPQRFIAHTKGVRLPSAPPKRKKTRNHCGCGFFLYSCGFADFLHRKYMNHFECIMAIMCSILLQFYTRIYTRISKWDVNVCLLSLLVAAAAFRLSDRILPFCFLLSVCPFGRGADKCRVRWNCQTSRPYS